jgi:basic membrane protein A
VAVAAAIAVGTALGSSRAPSTHKAVFKAALVSDVVGFNDSGFNKLQLAGLKRAAKKIHGKAIPLVSHSASDYQPNYTTAVHDGAKIIVAAGFLLEDTVKSFATQYPKIKFAITDDSVKNIGGLKNEEGITYATQQGGCLVGVLAAKKAKALGKKIIGVAGGVKIPPVDSYIAGYQYCAKKAVPGTQVLIQYSNDFADVSKCSQIAQNEIGQGAQVIFQVAGPCGDGALKEAATLGKWGIGVDADEYHVAKNILTSALKRTDVGVYKTVLRAATPGAWKGNKDILFSLKNGGVGVGKMSPTVKPAWIKLMNKYKAQIIKGTLKPPAVLH